MAGTPVVTVTERWADCFLHTPYQQLPPDVVQHAKRALLDFLGLALAGVDQPMSRIAARYFRGLGGRPEASLLLDQGRLPAIHAATVNGIFGHALDGDDGHRAAGAHPGVATVPAALAAAEVAAAPGRELLRALVFGYEVLVRLGAAMNPAHLERGFHTTATVGPFAAATAAALLLGLDRDGFARALGLAGLQGAGLMEVFHDGAMAKPFQAARASAAGLLAAQLAAEGAVGPRGILEGEQGFLAAMCGRRETGGLEAGLGQDWAIRGIYFKEHAACRHTHAAVDAAAALREQHALRPEQVERVLVQTYGVADRLCGDPRLPSGPSEAKFSLPFTVALGLTFGHARQSCFSAELIADGGLRALASRVRIEVDPSLDRLYPRQRPTRLEVLTGDGRRLRAEVMMARGEPELPLSQAELEAKFLDNARGRLSPEQARAVVDRIASLESLPDCSPLLDLLATRPVHDPLPA